jgi:hypothetical protein
VTSAVAAKGPRPGGSRFAAGAWRAELSTMSWDSMFTRRRATVRLTKEEV